MDLDRAACLDLARSMSIRVTRNCTETDVAGAFAVARLNLGCVSFFNFFFFSVVPTLFNCASSRSVSV